MSRKNIFLIISQICATTVLKQPCIPALEQMIKEMIEPILIVKTVINDERDKQLMVLPSNKEIKSMLMIKPMV